jgi:hypothetical protein
MYFNHILISTFHILTYFNVILTPGFIDGLRPGASGARPCDGAAGRRSVPLAARVAA